MAASVIQEAVSGASLTAGSATTITASITVSAGSRIHATAIGDTGTAATATFTDNSGQGVTWTSHGGPLNISNFRMFDGSSLQFPAGATFTVTCTFASAMSTRGLLLQEIAGADNNAVQDAKSQTQNPLGAGTDVITTPSMTASGAGLVVGVTRNNGGANLTAGTGFTGGTSRWTGSGDPTLGESKHVSAGATAATWSTTSAGGAWWSVAVIFGDASAGAAQVPFRRDMAVRAWDPEPPWPVQSRARAALLPSAPIDSPVPGWARRALDRIARDWWEPGDPWPTQRRKLLIVDTAVVVGQPPFVRRLPLVQDEPAWPQQRRQLLIVDTPAVIAQPPFARRTVPAWDEPPWPQQRRQGQPPVAPPPLLARGWLYQAVASWTEAEPPRQGRRFIVLAPVVIPDNPPIGWPRRLVTLRVRDTWEPPDPLPQALRRSGIDKVPASFVLFQGPFYAVVDHVELTLEASGAILAAVVDGAELTEHVDRAATSIAVDSVTTTVDR